MNPPPAGAPKTAAPEHAQKDHPPATVPASAPPVATPPMSAGGDAAPAPRSNAASGVTDPAPPREPGVATAEPKPPAVAPKVAAPAPAAGATPAERAPGAVNTPGPADATVARRTEPRGGGRGRGCGAGGAQAGRAAAPGAPVAPKPAAAAPAKPAPAVDEGRRSFMRFALPVGWVAFSAACASSLVATARFMFPNVLFEPPQSFKAGFPGEYNVGEVDVALEGRLRRLDRARGRRLLRDHRRLHPPRLLAELAARREQVQVPLPRQRVLPHAA